MDAPATKAVIRADAASMPAISASDVQIVSQAAEAVMRLDLQEVLGPALLPFSGMVLLWLLLRWGMGRLRSNASQRATPSWAALLVPIDRSETKKRHVERPEPRQPTRRVWRRYVRRG